MTIPGATKHRGKIVDLFNISISIIDAIPSYRTGEPDVGCFIKLSGDIIGFLIDIALNSETKSTRRMVEPEGVYFSQT